ncbi:MAG: hypothetical protein ACRC47_08585 [Shewanella sp.]
MKALILSALFVATAATACDFEHLAEIVPAEKLAAVEVEISKANGAYDHCVQAVEMEIDGFSYERCDLVFETALDSIAEKYEIVLPEYVD